MGLEQSNMVTYQIAENKEMCDKLKAEKPIRVVRNTENTTLLYPDRYLKKYDVKTEMDMFNMERQYQLSKKIGGYKFYRCSEESETNVFIEKSKSDNEIPLIEFLFTTFNNTYYTDQIAKEIVQAMSEIVTRFSFIGVNFNNFLINKSTHVITLYDLSNVINSGGDMEPFAFLYSVLAVRLNTENKEKLFKVFSQVLQEKHNVTFEHVYNVSETNFFTRNISPLFHYYLKDFEIVDVFVNVVLKDKISGISDSVEEVYNSFKEKINKLSTHALKLFKRDNEDEVPTETVNDVPMNDDQQPAPAQDVQMDDAIVAELA